MNKYNEAFTSLVIMLSGALREEFIGNEKIEKDNDCFYCNTLWECENTDEVKKYETCNECIKAHMLSEVSND